MMASHKFTKSDVFDVDKDSTLCHGLCCGDGVVVVDLVAAAADDVKASSRTCCM